MSLTPPDLTFDFTVFFDAEANVWCAQCHASSIFTEGDDLDEVRANCHEAVEVFLEGDISAPQVNVRINLLVQDEPFMVYPNETHQVAHA